MDIVIADLVRSAFEKDAGAVKCVSAGIGNLKSVDSDVTGVDREAPHYHASLSLVGDWRTRASGSSDLNTFVVDAGAHNHGRSRSNSLGGFLDRSPRRRRASVVGVIAGRDTHIE